MVSASAVDATSPSPSPSQQDAAGPSLIQQWRRPYSPGPLSEAEFEQYWEQGWVVKRGLLDTQTDLAPCLTAIERCARCALWCV